MSLLKVEGLSTRLASESGWVHALEDISLAIDPGKTYALVGESGCGKSMTALSIARLLPECGAIVAGSVRLAGSKPNQSTDLLQVSEAAMRAFRGKRVAMIFQEPGSSLNPVMTVGDQLAEVIGLHARLSKPKALQEAALWLGKVGLDEPQARLAQYPFQMSGGQKQRVMIAMALALKPDLLIADEPTTALDVSIQAQVLDLLKRLQKEQGMAMLLITHDLAIVKHVADTVGLMYAGELVESASVTDFFAKPLHPYAHALIRSLPGASQRGQALCALPGRVPSLVSPEPACRFASRCEFVLPECVAHKVNMLPVASQALESTCLHSVRCIRWQTLLTANHKSAQPIAVAGPDLEASRTVRLDVRGLTVSYRASKSVWRPVFKPVLQGLDLQLRAGQTVALVGESGSGKTTAARALLGVLPEGARVSGQVLLNGQTISSMPARGADGWRRKIQFVFQDPFGSMNPRHRVAEILEESLLALRPELDAPARGRRVLEVIEQVNLPPEVLTRFPHEFSGGQRQRIAIARALVSEPMVLICDEPTSALDVSVQAQILNLLQKLQRDTGVAILFITHNLAVVQYLADEVVVLKRGEVVERASAQNLFENPQHAYTRELLDALPIL